MTPFAICLLPVSLTPKVSLLLRLISKRYEPSASANVLDAQLEDIVLVMEASVAAEDKAGRDGAEP